MARGTQWLPSALVPEHGSIATMRIAVIDDGCRLDQAVPLALGAERVAAKEPLPRFPPPCRAVERCRHRITVASVVAVALLLLPPADRTVDRRADGHERWVSGTMVVMVMVSETTTPATDISVTGAALASIGIIYPVPAAFVRPQNVRRTFFDPLSLFRVSIDCGGISRYSTPSSTVVCYCLFSIDSSLTKKLLKALVFGPPNRIANIFGS